MKKLVLTLILGVFAAVGCSSKEPPAPKVAPNEKPSTGGLPAPPPPPPRPPLNDK